MGDCDIKFVNKEITPFGGLSLFFKMLERCHFDEHLEQSSIPVYPNSPSKPPHPLVEHRRAAPLARDPLIQTLGEIRVNQVDRPIEADPILGTGAPTPLFAKLRDHMFQAALRTETPQVLHRQLTPRVQLLFLLIFYLHFLSLYYLYSLLKPLFQDPAKRGDQSLDQTAVVGDDLRRRPGLISDRQATAIIGEQPLRETDRHPVAVRFRHERQNSLYRI